MEDIKRRNQISRDETATSEVNAALSGANDGRLEIAEGKVNELKTQSQQPHKRSTEKENTYRKETWGCFKRPREMSPESREEQTGRSEHRVLKDNT